ncbi:MAG: ribonuclease P protein component [Myxococcaceae bacterium]
MAERFPKSERLRKRREFLKVQDHGAKVSAGTLLALVQRNDSGVTRLGLTVSNKVGNSVVRNRIRRRLRELYRKRKASLPAGLDLVIIARGSAKDAGFEQLSRDFDAVAARLKRQF